MSLFETQYKKLLLECLSNICFDRVVTGSELAYILTRKNIKSGGIVLKNEEQRSTKYQKLKFV